MFIHIDIVTLFGLGMGKPAKPQKMVSDTWYFLLSVSKMEDLGMVSTLVLPKKYMGMTSAFYCK
jgi:hypothetical protein